MKKHILVLSFITICAVAHAQNEVKLNTKKENPVMIGQERSFTISKASLAIDPVLRMPDAQKNYNITSYEVSYIAKEKEKELIGPFKIQGNDMSKGMAADILNRAQPGDRMFFEEIVAVSNEPGKKPLKLAASIKIQ